MKPPRTCPYCDATDLYRIELPPEDGDETPMSYVSCSGCGATGPKYLENDLEGWEAWDHRAGEHPLAKAH